MRQYGTRAALRNQQYDKVYVVDRSVGPASPNIRGDVLLVHYFRRVAMESSGGSAGLYRTKADRVRSSVCDGRLESTARVGVVEEEAWSFPYRPQDRGRRLRRGRAFHRRRASWSGCGG